jgi:hypothetical protein
MTTQTVEQKGVFLGLRRKSVESLMDANHWGVGSGG